MRPREETAWLSCYVPKVGVLERSLCPGRRSLALAIGVAAGELDQHASGLGDLRRVGGLLPPPLAEAVVVVARDHVDVQVEDGLRTAGAVGVGLHQVDPARLEGADRP